MVSFCGLAITRGGVQKRVKNLSENFLSLLSFESCILVHFMYSTMPVTTGCLPRKLSKMLGILDDLEAHLYPVQLYACASKAQ